MAYYNYRARFSPWRLVDMVDNIKNSFVRNTIKLVLVALIVAGIVALVVAGAGVLGAIGLAFLVLLTIYFGSIRELAGSALLVTLLKTMGGPIKQLLTVWTTAPWVDRLFGTVGGMDYVPLLFATFFFFYFVSFATGSIKLFNIANSVDNSTKAVKEKKQAEEPASQSRW